MDGSGCDQATGRCATFEQQRFYWITATVIQFAGLVLLLRLFWEYRVNPGMRKPGVRVFALTILGDCLWIVVYFPYHLGNTIKVFVSGGSAVNIDNNFGCAVSGYFAAFSVSVSLFGLVVVAYAPYRLVLNARRFVSTQNTTIPFKWQLATFVLAWVCGTLWWFAGFLGANTGSFRGLYCAFTEWNNGAGYFMFILVALTFSLTLFFFLRSYQMLKQDAAVSSAAEKARTESFSEGNLRNNNSSSNVSLEAAYSLLKFGTLVLVAFLVCFGSFAITAFLNVIAWYPPIQWEMASGLFIKLKVILDVLIILALPSVKNGRRALLKEADKREMECVSKNHKLPETDTGTCTLGGSFTETGLVVSIAEVESSAEFHLDSVDDVL